MMAIETVDLLGVLSVVAYLAGVGAVTVLVWRLLQRGPDGRGVAAALCIVALLYIGAAATDAPGVLTVLRNGVDDIPPVSAARTGTFALWTWLLFVALLVVWRRRTA